MLAERGRQAIELATQRRFRLVLLDLMLPDIDGLAVLRVLRALPDPPSIVLVSGGASVASAVEAMRIGAQDFIEKPMPIADLLDVLAPMPVHEGDPRVNEPTKELATMITAVAKAPTDTRTVEAWAALVHMSRPSVVRRCLRVGVHAKQALDLGRLIRIVHSAEVHPVPMDNLDSFDLRTVRAMLGRAGMRETELTALSVAAFLEKQQLVRNAPFLDDLRSMLLP